MGDVGVLQMAVGARGGVLDQVVKAMKGDALVHRGDQGVYNVHHAGHTSVDDLYAHPYGP